MRKQPSMFKGDFVINNKGCEGVVVKYLNASKILVEFLDENRYRNWFEARDIREGVFKNPFIPTVEGIGFIGDGVHNTRLNGKQCLVHKVWSDMFTRCYNKNTRKKWASYEGCTVHKEWHNFQNFAEWYKNHKFYNKGYHLDKDILVRGNRVYSPETCCLVPPVVNLSVGIMVNYKGEHDGGVSLDKRCNKYNSSISKFGKERYLGLYDNERDAFDVYNKAKKEYMRELAIAHKEAITSKVYEALYNWDM